MSLCYIILLVVLGWFVFHIICAQIRIQFYNRKKNRREEDKSGLLKFYQEKEAVFFITSLLGGVFLFIILLVGTTGYMGSVSFVKEYESIQSDFNSRKDSFTEMERAALFTKVMSVNAQLAKYKFYNEAFFGILDMTVTDEIYKLQPLR